MYIRTEEEINSQTGLPLNRNRREPDRMKGVTDLKAFLKSALAAGAFLTLAAFAAPRANADNLVNIAAGNKDFSTLVAAVKAAGLVDALRDAKEITIFAPTNAAFEKLGQKTINDLLKPENKAKLTEILTYHVVPGRVMAADVAKLKDGTKVKTLSGKEITVRNKKGVKINNSRVVKTDIVGDNGVIHVIDTVLIPGGKGKGK